MPKEESKEYNLWEKLQTGTERDFSAFYDEYVDFLFSFGLVYTSDRELIKDSIHDLFIELHRYRRKLKREVNVKGYLIKSLRRKIFQNLKKTNKISLLDNLKNSDHLDIVEETFLDNDTDDRLHTLLHMIDKLPQRQKEALILKYQKEFSYPEIAEIMNISVESARTLVYRTIKSLRKNLKVDTLLVFSILLFYIFL